MKRRWLAILLPLILVVFGLYCSRGLFLYNIFATHDGDHHISRSFDAVQTLKEGHFPLRWAGSLNGFCGVPLFNFFYPLIYYLVFLINFLAKDVILSLKIICLLSFTIAPVFFYLWLKNETGNSLASFTGAFLYVFVPYRFLLVYVRFSPEFVAYTLLPILLWLLSLELSELAKNKKITSYAWILAFFSSLCGGFFVISHNFAVLLLLPVLVLYLIYKILVLTILSKNKLLLVSWIVISMIGLGSFFLGPMMLEKKYVKLSTVRTVDYRDHFPTLWQTVRSKWDYGNSLPGTEKDGMSFMLGYSQWLVLGLVSVFVVIQLVRKRKDLFLILPTLFWLIISLIALFLILPYSKFVWEKIKILQDIQFSWRFLGITSFTLACLAGFFLASIKNKLIFYFLSAFFLTMAFVGNRNHLRPQPSPYPWKYVDYEKNHDHRYATTSIFDDILNRESQRLCLPGTSIITSVLRKEVSWSVQRGNTFGKITFINPKEEDISLKLGLEFFPGIYKIRFNGGEVVLRNCEGKVCLDNLKFLKGGNYLEWRIVQSPMEKLFNLISLLTFIIWLLLMFLVLLDEREKK